jgi:hypothetical protein
MTRRFSRTALQAVDVDEALPATEIRDHREQQMQQLTVVDEETLEAMREVFAGTKFMADQEKVGMLLRLRAEVGSAWVQTRDAFLQIGRALADADRRMTEDEQNSFRKGFRRLFPFSDTVASQFRTIARAVDEGRLPMAALPGSYSTAYQMALLSSEQRKLAEREGLIRADVSRHAIIEFRRVTARLRPAPTRGMDAARIRGALARLQRSEAKMARALDEIRARIKEMEGLIQMGQEGGE